MNNLREKCRFYFIIMYNLIYPASLGAIFITTLENLLSLKNSNDSLPFLLFRILCTLCIIFYFLLDYYIGYDNHYESMDVNNKDNDPYTEKYFICDLVVVILLYISFRLLWLKISYMFFVVVSIICIVFIVYNYNVDKMEESSFSESLSRSGRFCIVLVLNVLYLFLYFLIPVNFSIIWNILIIMYPIVVLLTIAHYFVKELGFSIKY